LRARELRVVMTREDDRYVSLEERTSLANDARADLFVSIHANAARSVRARGIESYFASLEASDAAAGEVAARENRAFSRDEVAGNLLEDPLLALMGDLIATEHLADSNEFARLAQTEFVRLDEDGSRGVKQAPFVVLLGVQMPAALVEIGFLTNPDDDRALRTEAWKTRIADSLGQAIVAFGRRYDARRGVEEQHSLVVGKP
jgi:N-acetylmuramoyl-L-alanine amidase